jgi:hypothetical protein
MPVRAASQALRNRRRWLFHKRSRSALSLARYQGVCFMRVDWPRPHWVMWLVLCSVIVAGWTDLARGQDDATVALRPPVKPAISYQMKPVSADVANTIGACMAAPMTISVFRH